MVGSFIRRMRKAFDVNVEIIGIVSLERLAGLYGGCWFQVVCSQPLMNLFKISLLRVFMANLNTLKCWFFTIKTRIIKISLLILKFPKNVKKVALLFFNRTNQMDYIVVSRYGTICDVGLLSLQSRMNRSCVKSSLSQGREQVGSANTDSAQVGDWVSGEQSGADLPPTGHTYQKQR